MPDGQMDVYDVLREMGVDPDHPTPEERATAEEAVRDRPVGRVFRYQGEATIGFVASVKQAFGLDVMVSVYVPPDKIKEFEQAAEERGWPLAT